MYKVKVDNKNFAGMSHGLTFKGGVSETFDNEELYHRLLMKGYKAVEVKKPKKDDTKSKDTAKQTKEPKEPTK